ncbi:MAG TPA: UrcA family protein [Hyphomonadaceae bacterium]|jgi:UrcA family protein|nr:UrcA family protein [Hyphomonadaceae bacterium]
MGYQQVFKNSLVIAALAASVLSGPAYAQRPAEQVHVRYADLNLSTPAGARVLASRISLAARQICGERPTLGPKAVMQHRACMKSAERSAASQVAAVTGRQYTDARAPN